jgi:hypothetical protein
MEKDKYCDEVSNRSAALQDLDAVWRKISIVMRSQTGLQFTRFGRCSGEREVLC